MLPFAYVRGQNIELTLTDDGTASASSIVASKQSGAGEAQQLKSVLLAGEYIVPKQHQLQYQQNSNDGVDSTRGKKTKTLLIGGTHEHAATMVELEAPPNMEKASALLMEKMMSMYPALEKEGWRPSKCFAGKCRTGV